MFFAMLLNGLTFAYMRNGMATVGGGRYERWNQTAINQKQINQHRSPSDGMPAPQSQELYICGWSKSFDIYMK
jgi:hypothetical protein